MLGPALTFAGVFLLSFKLSLSYFCFLPLNILWLLHHRAQVGAKLAEHGQIVIGFASFVLISALFCFFGFSPTRSLRVLGSLAFFGLTIPATAAAVGRHKVRTLFVWLLMGQAISALLAVLYSRFPMAVPRLNGGAVTSSGQMAMGIVLLCGLILIDLPKLSLSRKNSLILAGISAANFAAVLTLGFARTTEIIYFGLFCALICGAASAALAWKSKRFALESQRIWILFATWALPVIAAVLLINLKRGPWAGAMVGIILLLWKLGRRRLVPLIIASALGLFLIQPIRDRIEKSSGHFSISGGRKAMWSVAGELSTIYPLGIGFKNSVYLSEFSTQIPKQLRHFHNNFLNILVETGWFGLGAFLWWIISCLSTSFAPARLKEGDTYRLPLLIGCAVIAWQTAGLVEYNFGDNEILVLVFALLGALSAITKQSTGPSTPKA